MHVPLQATRRRLNATRNGLTLPGLPPKRPRTWDEPAPYQAQVGPRSRRCGFPSFVFSCPILRSASQGNGSGPSNKTRRDPIERPLRSGRVTAGAVSRVSCSASRVCDLRLHGTSGDQLTKHAVTPLGWPFFWTVGITRSRRVLLVASPGVHLRVDARTNSKGRVRTDF